MYKSVNIFIYNRINLKMNFNNINCVSANYNTNWSTAEQRVNVFSLQKENYILQSKVNELTEVNSNLIEQLRSLDANKKELLMALQEIERLKKEIKNKDIEISNNEKFLKEFYTKSKNDNDHIIDLEDKIEHLNSHISESNNEINNLQSDIMTLKTEVENLRIFKTKYYNLMGVHEGTKKENFKLKKNLELFYKENHFAALKIKELELKCNSNGKSKEEEEIKSITSALVNKVNMLKEEISKLKKNK